MECNFKKYELRAGKTALLVKVVVAKPGDLNSILGTDTVEVTSACCPMTFICLHAYVHTHRLNEDICKV